jgi:ankyrin repeat protein
VSPGRIFVMLANGADVRAKNGGGVTALHMAAGHGQLAITKLLLEKAKAKDQDGRTAYNEAQRGGYTEVSTILFRHL